MAIVVAALAAGLVSTPTGAAARPARPAAQTQAEPAQEPAAEAGSDPAAEPTPPSSEPTEPAPGPSAPADEPGPAPTPGRVPAPGAPSEAPAPTPDGAVDDVADPEVEEAGEPTSPVPEPATPEPTPTEDEAEQTDALPAENAHSPPTAARSTIGILAAGVPEAAAQVWVEGFEQNLGTAPVSIAGYPPGAAARYTAAAFWQNLSNCTGVLVQYDAAFPGNNSVCSTMLGLSTLPQRQTRRMADVLGQVAAGVTGGATTPANQSTATTRVNHALTSTTQAASSTANQVVLESATGLGVAAPGPRYYVLSLDMVGDECTANPAQLDAFLVVGTAARQLTSAPLSACALTGGLYTSPTIDGTAWSTSVRAGRLTTDSSVLLTGAEAGSARLRLTNRTSASAGNVFGVDNLRLLDATPSLDLAFAPASVVAGTPSTLTYTVTNTTELAAKTDWSFTNALPSGLVVAPTPGVGGTCANVTGTAFGVTAASGATSIAVAGGDLGTGTTSCTITVNVVSNVPGTYTNASANVTTALVPPPAAVLTVTPATTITVRKILTSRTSTADQFTLSLRSGTTVLGSATTSGTATGLQSAQVSRVIVQPGTTYTIHETATSGAGLGYAASYECVRGSTVIAAGASASGTIVTPAEPGAEIVCTFTNAPQTPRLACDTSRMYSISPTGALTQADIVTASSTSVGSWPGATNANALGVGAGGSVAYAIERSADASDVAAILKWTPSGGFQTVTGTAYTTRAGTTEITGSVVAGAVDLSGSRYYFGKFANSQFFLWSFTETNPAASRFTYVGSFPTGATPNGNGDLAFDARGNLYVLGAVTSGTASSAGIYTVPADALAAANGSTLTVHASIVKNLAGTESSPAFGNVNGIAFSPRGTAYLSSTTSVYEFDPTTWMRMPGTPRIAVDSTDLAGCTSPATITVLKHAVGRINAADQFSLTLANGSTAVATATTAGAATGRQPQQIGPVPAVIGTTLSVSEAMAPGSPSAISAYTIVQECWADGVRLSTGTSPAGTVTMPSRGGVNVVCTFFNSPRPASTVTLTKQVIDPATGTPRPAAGWTLGTAASATTGTATVLPSEAPRQQTDAAGTASWLVLFGSTASRATLVITEEQQTGHVFAGGSCTVNGVATPVTFTTAGGVVSGSIAGVASASTIACTLVNRPVAALTLVAAVSFGSASVTDWQLSASGPSGALPGPSGRSGGATASAVPVTPGVPYRLAQSGGQLSYVQAGPWRCVDGAGQAVPVSAAGDVTLVTGSTVTCTVTFATSAITLLKQVQSPQPGFQPSDWTLTATPAPLAAGSLPTQSRPGADAAPGGNAASTVEVRPGHGYTLSEAPARAGSRLAYRTIRLERLDGGTWTEVPSARVTAPSAGETAVYRFVNAPVQPTALPLTGGTSADAFLIAGGGLLALALLAAAGYAWRRRRGGAR